MIYLFLVYPKRLWLLPNTAIFMQPFGDVLPHTVWHHAGTFRAVFDTGAAADAILDIGCHDLAN